MHIIQNMDDIRAASDELAKQCDYMARALDICDYPPLRLRDGGLEGLTNIIVGQQLSIASAKAIWSRVEPLFEGDWTYQKLHSLDDEILKSAGLSRPKIKTLRAVQTAIETGGLDLDHTHAISDEDARAQLIAIKGIGPWTADIYLMFCIGKCDQFAPGDLALQIAAQDLMALKTRPTIKEMEDIALRWKPYRSIAARLLWLWYRVEKNTKSGMPI